MPIAARDALEYASRDEFLKLYAVLAGGWAATLVGTSIAGSALNSLLRLVGALVSLGGLLAVLVGLVAVLHKVLAES
ncbi:hypothetical protein M0R88_14835 [Halorussus gelatinilyticus]|uniref:Uncharacterized protein n=1 Tax=Halorussus gelatinilyticus TaxID=2937524 RepID=A0A8U0IFM7_9EURY|nr:hypothetical protein [Halorussus gelatinilyticus]UPV99782.1 hypothetical protein M0R88_14835 [Halorussus gelatinilyticus]